LERVRIAHGVTLAARIVGKRLGVFAHLARHALTLVGPRATGGAARARLAALAGGARARLAALARGARAGLATLAGLTRLV
jgi:hypothetical protein